MPTYTYAIRTPAAEAPTSHSTQPPSFHQQPPPPPFRQPPGHYAPPDTSVPILSPVRGIPMARVVVLETPVNDSIVGPLLGLLISVIFPIVGLITAMVVFGCTGRPSRRRAHAGFAALLVGLTGTIIALYFAISRGDKRIR